MALRWTADDAWCGQTPVADAPAKAVSRARRASTPEVPAARLQHEALWRLSHSPRDRGREAVGLLEKALALAPASASIRGDLAAALALVATTENDPAALADALETLEIALETDPRSLQLLFNHAMVLGEMGLDGEAASAWARFLRAEPSRTWSDAAALRLKELTRPERVTLWAPIEARLLRQGEVSDQELPGLLAGARQQAREFGEERLLARWGKDGDRYTLDAAERLGTVLVRLRGDPLLAESASRLRVSDSAKLATLRSAHKLYGEGLAAYRRGDLAPAATAFSSALSLLQRGQSPMAFWATLHLEILAYFKADYAGVRDRIGDLLRSGRIDRYPSLRARFHWILGLARGKAGDLVGCRASYEDALALYRELGEQENEVVVVSLLAEVLDDLGDGEAAWGRRLGALHGLEFVVDPRRRHNILYEVADALRDSNRLRAALRILDGMTELAVNLEDPFYGTEAGIWRARTLAEVGSRESALLELVHVERDAARIQDASIRERTLADVALTRGSVALDADPGAALAHFEHSLDLYRGNHDAYHFPELYRARAKALRRLGMNEAALTELEAGIQLFEESRERVPRDDLRASYFERSRPLFDDAAGLLVDLARTEEAWSIAERARARVLLDLASPQGNQPRRFSEVQQLVPEDGALLQYAVLPEETILWVLRRHTSEVFRLATTQAELEHLTEGLAQGSGSEATILEELHRRVLAPASTALVGARRLVVLPDKALHRIPFSVLRDRGRFLFEHFTVSVAPSASLWAHARSKRSGHATPTSVFAVAASSAGENPGLRPLPDAQREVTEVAALYPRSTVLSGAGATEEALLAGIVGHDVLHVAAHAVLNPRYPLFSYIPMARSELPSDDGILYAYELYARDLSALQLVVLAGCRTAGGPATVSEGPASLARPFLAHGVPNVLATLWDVEDAATAELLVKFHRHVQAGLTPAGALRSAQLEFLGTHGPESVSQFGAFVMLGAE